MLITNITALLLYLGASAYLLKYTRDKQTTPTKNLLLLATACVIAHTIGVFYLLRVGGGIDMSIHKMGSLIVCAINIIVLISSFRKPLHALFVFLFPLAIISILFSLLLSPEKFILSHVNIGLAAHILLSIVAYSLIAMATLQALLWYWQNQQLRAHKLSGPVTLLPPLQTMESLIFDLLWAGQILLTLGIVIGLVSIDNIFAQQLVHKTVLSLFAWLIFAALLWGRHTAGWRGNVATRWVLTGFCLLMLGYFGSKVVIELFLNN